jgi:hypothetical protein
MYTPICQSMSRPPTHGLATHARGRECNYLTIVSLSSPTDVQIARSARSGAATTC